MKSNSFVCSFCRSENSPKLYFLPCLNIFCNKCGASQIRSSADYNKSTSEKVDAKEKEYEKKSESAGINIFKSGERSFYSLARDDESYETIAAEEFVNKECANNDEGYEIPYNHNLYQNSSISTQVSKVIQLHLNGECFYEEVASKSIKKTKPLKADDEVFEEIHVKQLENLTKNIVNLPPKASFHKKSATFPISNDSRFCPNPTDIPFPSKQEESQFQKCDKAETSESLILNEMLSVRDDAAVHFKCPFCQDLHWISEQGELFTQFPACPRNCSSISSGRRTEIIEFLSHLQENCCSKLCNNPNKSKYCIRCGKTLCESCVSCYHSKHRTYEMEFLNSRYKSLVECYKASNEQRKQSCVDEVEKLQSGIGNLISMKAKTIETLSKQKKLLMMELDRVFKDKVNTLERNVGLEISQLEASLNQINSQVSKMNRFLDFSEAFLDHEYSSPNKLNILQSIISSHPTLEQFKMPDRKEPINICMEQHEMEASELSRMLGEVYFRRKSPGVFLGESTKERSDSHPPTLSESGVSCEISADPGKASSKPGGMKSIKGRVNRMSRIFKRTNFPPKKEAGRTQKGEADDPKSSPPGAIFNLQLTSDDEDCRLTDFFMSSGQHIVALDSSNHCLKLLNLGNDSLKVLPLDKIASVPLKVALLENNGELLVIVVQRGSNCIKLYAENGQELLRIGESYLLSVSSVATNSLKQIFASDTVHMKVFAYDCSGNMLFSFPRGSRHGMLKSPQCFVPLEIRTNHFNDDLVVLDATRMSFLVFDRVGTYLFHLPFVAGLSVDSSIASNQLDHDSELEINESYRKESKPKSISHLGGAGAYSIEYDRNCSGIIFDKEGCIYQRSDLGDKLIVHDCNGRLKSEIPVHIPDFSSSRLISVLDCHVRRATDETASEKSIILSSQPSTVSVYKLAFAMEGSTSDSALTPTDKEVDDEMISFKIIESRYADMTGKKQDVDLNLHPLDKAITRSMQENIYTTISEQIKSAEPKSKPKNQRFSMRVKQIFKSKGSSNALLAEVGD